MAPPPSGAARKIASLLASDPEREWTSTEIREDLGFGRAYIFRLLGQLVDEGAIELASTPGGRSPWTYRWVEDSSYLKDQPDTASAAVPSAESLKALRNDIYLGLQATVTGVRLEGGETVLTLTTGNGAQIDVVARGKSS